MNRNELDHLLKSFENHDLEFRYELGTKEDKDRDVKTLAALLNTRGGKIIFGVEEDGNSRKVVGLKLPPQVLESNFVSKISAKCDPPPQPFPTFEFHEIGGHNLVVVTCERGAKPPYKASGQVYIRKGSNNIIATEGEIADLYRQNVPDSDRKPVRGATMEDLDLELAKATLERRDRVQVLEGDLLKLLSRIGATVDVGGQMIPTTAGLILFGRRPQDFLPNARIRAEAKADTNAAEWDDIAEINGNIFDQIKGFEGFVRRNVKVSARIVGFERMETPDVPIEALREAVINALIHRDYGDAGSEIQIRIHGKTISIENPGALIAPLTMEQILGRSFIPKTRNPVMADMLVQLGYMDKRGTGFSRMFYLCEEVGLPTPSFEELPSGFRVTFVGSPKEIARTAIVIPENLLRKARLKEEHKRILKYIQQYGSIGSTDAQHLLSRSKPHAIQRLNELSEWGILETTETQKNSPKNRYVISKKIDSKPKKLSTDRDPGQRKINI